MKSTINEEPITIRCDELELLSTELGVKPGLIRANTGSHAEILSGNWKFQSRENAIRLHYGSFQALSDLSVSFELPPGLSLTIVFEGTLDIVLGTNAYTLGKQFRPVECAAFCVSRPEIITRHQAPMKSVRKLNLFVEQGWLQSFCKTDVEINCLNYIFQQPGILSRWLPDKQTLDAATKVMGTTDQSGFMSEIERESSVFLLLSLMLKSYKEELDASTTTSSTINRKLTATEPVREFLDSIATEIPSLDLLAKKFNVSVSTLQRRFKSQHGITVMNYIRQNNLDNARMHLIEDRLSIGEIAYLSGYKHSSNFINAFIRRFQTSPSSFRSAHQK